jgi:hypothetical protein
MGRASNDTGGGGASGGGGAGGAGSVCTVPSSGPPRTGADRQVRDMTATEAEAWCSNYVNVVYQNGSGDPPTGPGEYPGYYYPAYVESYATTWCQELIPGGGCVTQPSLADCVTNLLHAPCEATITSMNDCVASFFNSVGDARCVPVGAGCTAFSATPHCEQTVIMTLSLQPPPDPPNPDVPQFPNRCMLRLSPDCP